MLLDVAAGKLIQVWTLAQANLFGLLLSLFDGPPVAQSSSNHPKHAHSNCRRAMNKRRSIGLVIGDFKELGYLFLFGLGENYGDVEVAQAQFPGLGFFFSGAMLARRSQVDD